MFSRKNVEEIAAYFQIDCVPIAFRGTLIEGVNYVLEEKNSLIAVNGDLMEGLIGTPTVDLRNRLGERIITKLKLKELKKMREVK